VLTDPEVIRFVEETEVYYPASTNEASAEENRRIYDRTCAAFRAPRPANVTVRDFGLPASDPERRIPLRAYSKAEMLAPFARQVLYLHGGGFVVGGLDSHDDVCAEICAETGLPVLSVDYRMAPEHIFPAALDDAWAVYLHLLEEKRDVTVVGDSAGGTLSAGICRRAMRLGILQPLKQVLIYPALSPNRDLPSYVENAEAPMLRSVDCEHYRQVYSGGLPIPPELRPEFTPLAADSFRGLAPAFVVTADIDPLRDDGREYVARLKDEGVAAKWRNEEQLVHSYLRARHSSRRAAESFKAIIAAIAG